MTPNTITPGRRPATFGVTALPGLLLLGVLVTAGAGTTAPKPAVKIGCITPLTVEGAYGQATKRGIDLAIDRANSEAGAKGRKIQVIYEDDQMDAKMGGNAIRKLISVDKVPAIIGPFGSTVTLAVAPVAEKNKVVLFTASSTADSIKDAGDYIFRNVPPNARQGSTAAEFALSRLKAKTSFILNVNNDYGISLANAFRSRFQKNGKVLGTESHNRGDTDFRAQLTKVRALNPDVIFFPGHYPECALILKQAQSLRVKAPFIGADGSYGPELIKVAGAAADGSYYTSMAMPNAASDKEAKRFVTTFKAKYREEPDVYSAYAYDAALTLAKAIGAGATSGPQIKSALYQMKPFKGAAGVTKFDRYGEVDKPFGIYKVQAGKFVPAS